MLSRSVWAPPTREGGAAWCERTHRLSTGARPGPLRWDPHQREIVDALTRPGAPHEVYMMASAQGSGKSTIVRGATAFWLAEWRAPVLYVLPDENSAADIMQGDLTALVEDNSALRALRSENLRWVQRLGLRLMNGARVRMAWAGSPARIAQHPARCGVAEEIDKWPAHAGNDADPMALVLARYKTFEPRHKHVGVCTPTTPDGRIAVAWETTQDRRVWALPCPACDARHPLAWDNVRWPAGGPACHPSDPEVRIALAAELMSAPSLVTILCPGCGAKIGDPELRRARASGRWIPAQGARPDAPGAGLSRAYQLSDLATMPLARTAAAYLRAITPAARQEFDNQTLGQAHADSTGEIPEWLIRKQARFPDGEVPAWATAVVAAADTQADHWWYTVRAVGPDQRSRGLAWGRAETWEALVAATLGRVWRGVGRETRASALGVDVRGGDFGGEAGGQRTELVYAHVRETPGAVAILGEDMKKIAKPEPWVWAVSHQARVLRVHVHYWKDVLSRLVASEEPVLFEEPVSALRDPYPRQLSAEIRVKVALPNGGVQMEWRPRSHARPNHLFDATVYCTALADALGYSRRAAPEATGPPEATRRGSWKIGR